MFNKRKTTTDFDFSDESLGKALENQDWHWFEGSSETCDKIPLLLFTVMQQVKSFDYNEYWYFVDRFGYLMRRSPKIKPPPENLQEKVAYWIDGVAVKVKDLEAKAKAIMEDKSHE